MITAIILAAGASERMGRPKALLPFQGGTFLETTVAKSRAAGVDSCVVVLGPDAGKIIESIDLSDATVVRNDEPASGPIGSIRLAIDALNRSVDAVLVWHVDRAHVAVATLAKLLDRFMEGGAAVVLPVHAGRRGHPVIFGREVFDELREAPDAEGARAVVRADPSRVALVPVEDRAVLEDIDTPEAYADLLRRIDAADTNP